jgi:hypothetical protein
MVQNWIALTIVFSAAGYTLFSIVKNLTAKKTSHCGGCEGCNLKEFPMAKQAKAMQAGDIEPSKFTVIKNGK